MKEPKPTPQSILIHTAQEDIPEHEIDLWPGLHQTLVSSRISTQQGNTSMFSRRTHKHPSPVQSRFVFGTALVLIIFAVLFLLIPEKQALAEAWKHLFKPLEAEQLPTPSLLDLATPTFAPTFAAMLVPAHEEEVTDTPIPTPTSLFQSPIMACGEDLYGYACQIAKAEKQVGFDAKEFPADPKAFVFRDVVKASEGVIMIEYGVIGGGGYLYLNQGVGELPYGSAPESAIEPVMVGKYPGEYVIGMYANDSQTNKTVWDPTSRFRLRWTEGDRWFELDKVAALPHTDYMTREVMIQMAQNLVNQPEPVQELRADYLTSFEEASQIADFDIVRPTVLPEDFQFSYASYDLNLGLLKIHYTPAGDPTQAGVTEILIIETPLEKIRSTSPDHPNTREGEKVEVNGYPAVYLSGPDNHSVNWQTDQLQVLLMVSTTPLNGARLTQEQVLEIAQSVR